MKNRNKNKKRNEFLSTNNKNFTTGGRTDKINIEQEISPFIKDEDVRLEKVRDSRFAAEKANQYVLKNENICSSILDESRNGYNVTTKAPYEHTAAIKHYTKMLRRFTLDFPEEWGLCHYSLGKIFSVDHRPNEDRSRSIENGLFHYKTCSQIFTADTFPAMSAIVSLLESSLSREKASMIRNREYTGIVQRSPAITSTEIGIELAESALNFFTREPHRYQLEQAFTRFELGWLFYLFAQLSVETITTENYILQLETSISHMERALSLFERLNEDKTFTIESLPPVKTNKNNKKVNDNSDEESNNESEDNEDNNDDDNSIDENSDNDENDNEEKKKKKSSWFNLPIIKNKKNETKSNKQSRSSKHGGNGSELGVPYNPYHHLRVLLKKKSLIHYIGMCHSLLGQAYYGLCLESDQVARKDTINMAYEYLSNAIKPKYNLKETIDWVIDRILIANIVVKDPSVIDRDSSGTQMNPDVGIEVALSHLNLALSAKFGKKKLPEIYFGLAQTTFSKLHFLRGRVVSPQSFGIPLSDGSMPIDILKESEKYYLEVVKLVSGVSKQAIESYFSYYSTLKLAELRVLQAIAINYPNNTNDHKNISHVNDIVTKSDRDYYFESALKYLLDALQAKKPFENTDLHFLCSSQMGYLLSIGPKKELSVHCFVRSIFCLSCLILRSRFVKQLQIPDNSHLSNTNSNGSNNNYSTLIYEVNNLGVKKVIGIERRSPQYQRPHYSNQQICDESKRLTSLALLASLKLVRWMKPSKQGSTLRPGYGLWNFEEYAPFATRIEALSGDSLRSPSSPTSIKKDGLSSKVIVQSTNPDEPNTILIQTKSGIIRRTPSQPLDPPPRNSSKQIEPSNNNITSLPVIKNSNNTKKTIEMEIEVEEKEVIKAPTFINSRDKPLRDARGNIINIDEVPIAPDNIKAPPKEYEDITITKTVKKKIQKEVDDNDNNISNDNESNKNKNKSEKNKKQFERTTSKPFYNPDGKSNNNNNNNNNNNENENENENSDNENNQVKSKRESSFLQKLSSLFLIKSKRNELSRKAIQTASNSITNTVILPSLIPQKINEAIASTNVKNKVIVEIIGSEHSIFGLTLLSHLYRQILVLKSIKLNIGKGARVKSLLSTLGTENDEIENIKKSHKAIKKYCEQISPCPWSLQELSESCTPKELKLIFKSQLRASNNLLLEENSILTFFAKLDIFLALTLTIPSYTRLTAEDSTPHELKLDETNILLSNNVVRDPIAEIIEAEPRARRQAKFGKKKNEIVTSSPVIPLLDSDNFHPLGLPSGAHIGINGYTKRDGRRLWASYLDSTSKGIDNFMTDYLPRNEAILHWHLFTSSLTSLGSNNCPLQCFLIWKDVIKDVPPYVPSGYGKYAAETLSQRAILTAKQFADKRKELGSNNVSITDFFTVQDIEKVFIESCQSDVDLSQINFALSSFVDSLHSRPAPIRSSKLTSALTLLSECFALTELLSKLPSHIDTLVFCFPPSLSIVPWSLLLIEDFKSPEKNEDPFDRTREKAYNVGPLPEDSKPISLIHVIDKYVVRLGTSLSMMELNADKATKLSQAPGMHKLCYIDADDQAILPLSELETLCTTNLWSGDYWDYNVIQGIWAATDVLSTKLSEKTFEEQTKTRIDKKLLKEKMKAKLHEIAKKQKKQKKQKKNEREKGNSDESSNDEKDNNNNTDDEKDNDDDDDDDYVNQDSEEDSSDEESTEDKHTKFKNSKSIANCRVLHLSAVWDSDSFTMANNSGISQKLPPALLLPDIPVSETKSKKKKETKKKRFDAQTIISQLYFKNCALVTLSRIGILDNIESKQLSLSSAEGGIIKDTPWDIIEAFHLAGASTVLFSLWGGGSMGGDLGQLARILLLLRFYYELPSYAHYSHSIAKALQVSQIWLRETTMSEIITFIETSPFPLKSVNELKSILASFEKSYLKKSNTNELNQNLKLFSHYFYWGQFVVSGEARNVHPSKINEINDEVNEEKQRKLRKLMKNLNINPKEESKPELQNDVENYQKEIQKEKEEKEKEATENVKATTEEKNKIDENYLENMRNEINFLKMEGNYMKANILEKKLNEIYLQNIQDNIHKIMPNKSDDPNQSKVCNIM